MNPEMAYYPIKIHESLVCTCNANENTRKVGYVGTMEPFSKWWARLIDAILVSSSTKVAWNY